MTDAELKKLTLASAAAKVRRKEISPVELTEAILRRVDRVNGQMRAFITVTSDLAMETARRTERNLMSGKDLGPLAGVPISLKDLYDTQGIRTTAGAKVFEDRIPAMDATVVRKVKEAGAVLIGKANMHEFA